LTKIPFQEEIEIFQDAQLDDNQEARKMIKDF
jgi:hypothetical protein